MKSQKPAGSSISPLSSETIAISHLSIPEIEECSKWIRTDFGGNTIADTTAALILRRAKRLPVYCIPKKDVRLDLMENTRNSVTFPPRGIASYWNINVGERNSDNAAWSFDDPTEGWQALKDYLVFEWGRMDAWFEEDEEIFVHLKDPYHRIDVLKSSPHIRVVAGGNSVADTRRPVLLFETGFPTRFYIPKDDVALEFLEQSDLQTRGPYKGIASAYWSIKIGDTYLRNSVWSYTDPLPEAYKIKDYLCFFNEKVDAIYLNNALVPKPETPWS
jgi:uncharacterized protein (DUF427 family)